MVSALVLEARGLGLSPSRGHCVVFSPLRGINGYRHPQIVRFPQQFAGEWSAMD